MRTLLLIIGVTCVLAGAASACFGPKLYLGVAAGSEGALQYALVALYVKEKTGTEVEKVVHSATQQPREMVVREEVDFAFVEQRDGESTLITLGDVALLTGQRIRTDLQFTTTIPALTKLARQLTVRHYAVLLEQVKQGGSPLALVREFYFSRGWI